MRFWDDEIAELPGVTKNAVIGRAKRLGLSRAKETRITFHKPLSPLGSWRRKWLDRIQRMFRPRQEPVPVVAPPGGIAIMSLTNAACRWPVFGTGADMMYCGGKVHKEKSYCLKHCRVAFNGFKG